MSPPTVSPGIGPVGAFRLAPFQRRIFNPYFLRINSNCQYITPPNLKCTQLFSIFDHEIVIDIRRFELDIEGPRRVGIVAGGPYPIQKISQKSNFPHPKQ